MESALRTETDGSMATGRASSSRRRGRRRGVEIRPGSVKEARREAGLSLGQVAQDDISRTAIYFVETGKAKPSIETLRLIALRTNKPLDFFLGDTLVVDEEVAVAELERLVATGENAEAVAAGDAFLAGRPGARSIAHARFLLSNALIRLGRPIEGRAHVSAARVYFEQAGDALMVADCLGWEAGAAMLMQDNAAALGLAEDALARCRALKPAAPTTEARILSILGHVRNARHEYKKAIAAYEESLALDADTPDLRRLSYVYANLQTAYQELGRYAESARYARRSRALYETLRDRVGLVWCENNLAMLVYKQGDLEAALRHAETSLALAEELGVESGRAHVLMTLAEIELARNGYDAASRWAAAAVEYAEKMHETLNVGDAHTWAGRVAAARGDAARADAEFGEAFRIFESEDAADWLARAHCAYAEILEARGQLAAANGHLRSAISALGMPNTGALGLRVAIA